MLPIDQIVNSPLSFVALAEKDHAARARATSAPFSIGLTPSQAL
jgi:hypothetical protein